MTFSPAKFRLRPVSEQDEISHNHSLNYLQWGKGLTLKEYIEREAFLRSQTSCSDGNLRFWSFEQHDSNTGKWFVVSCLETLTRPSLYKIKGKPVQASVSHSIGAVFTPKEHRGKGYAKRLLEQVVKEFDNRNSWQQYKGLSEEALEHSFSALWSDVGMYYAQFGYKATNADELEIQVGAEEYDNQDVTWITEDMIPALCADDEAQLKAKMDADTEQDGVTRVAISPTEHVHELTHARAHYLAPIVKPEETKQNSTAGGLHRFGAKLNGVWILWTQDFSSHKLNILRVHHDQTAGEDEFLSTLGRLLQAAESECQSWSLPKIILWKQDLPRLADGKYVTLDSIAKSLRSPCKVQTRTDSSLPMWRFWQGLDKDPATGSPIEWVMDGKYAWF